MNKLTYHFYKGHTWIPKSWRPYEIYEKQTWKQIAMALHYGSHCCNDVPMMCDLCVYFQDPRTLDKKSRALHPANQGGGGT